MEPIETIIEADMFRAYNFLYDTFENAGQAPKLKIMENESSTPLKHLLQKRRTVVQLAPSHSHRRNAAERAIRTFNNRFLAGLASVDNNFPIYLLCRMVKQEEITINLLRTSITNPMLLAYAQIFGKVYFNTTPMAPPETNMISHGKPAHW